MLAPVTDLGSGIFSVVRRALKLGARVDQSDQSQATSSTHSYKQRIIHVRFDAYMNFLRADNALRNFTAVTVYFKN